MARTNLSAAMLASAVLLLAGCGGGSSSLGVAHLPSTSGDSAADGGGESSTPESSASTQQKMVAYSQCMRTHGVPEFPEPVEGHVIMKGGLGSGQNPGSAQFQAAEKQCRKLVPNGGKLSPQVQKQAEERALEFAACMRSHGEPDFPDPKFDSSGGGFHVTISGPGSGIDPGSPQFKAAAKHCQQYFGPPGSKGGQAVAPSGGGSGSVAAAP